MSNGIIERKINFFDGGYAHIVITEREYNAKDKSDLRKVSELCDINYDNIVDNIQIHSGIVYDISYNNIGIKMEGDGLLTSELNLPLLVYTADCVPVVIVDRKNKVVANVHAGWRGTFEKIAKVAVDMMIKNYKSRVEDIVCIIGPSIGPCCYEVSEDLIKKFNTIITKDNLEFYIIRDGKYYLDLWKINEYILESCGIPSKNIEKMEFCTSCECRRFYSYRKDNGTDRRIGTIVQIKE